MILPRNGYAWSEVQRLTLFDQHMLLLFLELEADHPPKRD